MGGGGGGQNMSVFVHAQVIKTLGKKWPNSVHVVVECPLTTKIPANIFKHFYKNIEF